MGRAIDKIANISVPKEPRTTYAVSVISGGTSVNSIAAEAVMLTDTRSVCAQQLDNHYHQHLESALDDGHGSCHMKNPELAQIVADAITHFDGERYDLAAWCVMPNHVHLLIKPLEDHSLSSILQGIKGVSARKMNEFLRYGMAKRIL